MHMKILKYKAVIAQIHKQKVAANLQCLFYILNNMWAAYFCSHYDAEKVNFVITR